MAVDVEKLKRMAPPGGGAFHIAEIDPVVLRVADFHRARKFYTNLFGFNPFEEAIANPVPGQDSHLPR